jgi:hypothetical protein
VPRKLAKGIEEGVGFDQRAVEIDAKGTFLLRDLDRIYAQRRSILMLQYFIRGSGSDAPIVDLARPDGRSRAPRRPHPAMVLSRL